MPKKTRRIRPHFSNSDTVISKDRLYILEELAKQNDVKTEVIFQLKSGLRRALENQERLLKNAMSLSEHLVKSETALNLYRAEVLSDTKRRLSTENFGLLQFKFDTERGWTGAEAKTELALAK